MSISPTQQSVFNPDAPEVVKILKNMNTPFLMWLLYRARLPSIVYWGVKIKNVTPYKSILTLPYKHRTQNPFKSIYFAAQCGAAELSTGLLSRIAIEGRGRLSMLIVHQEAEYVKKAASLTTFVCEDGEKIHAAVQKAIETGEGAKVTVQSIGTDATGNVVSRFKFTWSFKVKSS